MVLSAVESIRRDIWFEVRAPQCPQRARMIFHAAQGPPTRSARTLAPPGHHPAWRRQDGIPQKFRQVGVGWPDQLNVSPDRQMLCKMTDSFRANAMRALPAPDRFAIASAQSF